MAEQEDPELISSHRYTKITTIYGVTIDGKDRNLAEKIFYNERYKQGTTRQVRGVEMQYRQDPYPQVGDPQTGG